jgi:hypothetical protein
VVVVVGVVGGSAVVVVVVVGGWGGCVVVVVGGCGAHGGTESGKVSSVSGHPGIVGSNLTVTGYVPGKVYVWVTDLLGLVKLGDPSPKSQVKSPEAFVGVVTATKVTATGPVSSTQAGSTSRVVHPVTLGQGSSQSSCFSQAVRQVAWAKDTPAGSSHHAQTEHGGVACAGSWQRHPSPVFDSSTTQFSFTTGALTVDEFAQSTRTLTRLLGQSTALPVTRMVVGVVALEGRNPTTEVMVIVQAKSSLLLGG